MATLIGEHIRFLHVPKTGGSWATQAMFAAGVKADRPAHVPFHATLEETDEYSDRFTFACIRHPLELWRSYWAYRIMTGWIEDHPLDPSIASDDLDEFLLRLVEVAPGHASERYEQFVGPAGGDIDFICRHEQLVDDLCLALRLSGEPFDEAKLRAQPRVNVSDSGDRPMLISRRAAEAVAAAESPAIERFYPWEPLPQHLIAEPITSERSRARMRRWQTEEIELRDARAELAKLRRAHAQQLDQIGEQAARLQELETALSQMRGSRLFRWSRSARLLWYRIRPRRWATA